MEAKKAYERPVQPQDFTGGVYELSRGRNGGKDHEGAQPADLFIGGAVACLSGNGADE